MINYVPNVERVTGKKPEQPNPLELQMKRKEKNYQLNLLSNLSSDPKSKKKKKRRRTAPDQLQFADVKSKNIIKAEFQKRKVTIAEDRNEKIMLK
jgi:hypothetical protein